MSAQPVRWRVGAEQTGQRLDVFLARQLDVTRSQAQRLIRNGHVTLSTPGKAKASTAIQVNLEIRCQVPDPEADPDLQPEAGELSVLFEDEHLAVLNKPAGLAIHPGAGRPDGTLVNRLIHHYPEIATLGGRGRPGIVHRLDLDTTGAVVVARTDAAMRRLQEAFAERSVSKTYLAIVHGVPSPAEGLVETPIGRHATDRKRMTVRFDGRPARTGYRTLGHVTARQRVAASLKIALHTGRTHQIRVHMKSIGHPLVGDPTYGEARWRSAPPGGVRKALADFPRPALHAWKLALDHPVTGDRLECAAPVPDDMTKLWNALGGQPAFGEI